MKRKGILLAIAGALLAAVAVIVVVMILRQGPMTLTAYNYAITVTKEFDVEEDSEYALEAYYGEQIGLVVGCFDGADLREQYGEQTTDGYFEKILEADGAYDIEYGTTASGKPYATYHWDDEDGGVYFFVSALEQDPADDVYWFTDFRCGDENREEYETLLVDFVDSVTLQ